ncbi:MAG: amino acid adenylation domain-containing protein, partial [Myxococcota bacterium]
MKIPQHSVEDIYELTPAQAGMLFHSLGSVRSGVYVQQLWWTLEGSVDLEMFVRAWDRVAARHAVLRTSFHWAELERPYQVVHRSVRTPFIDEDLSALDAGAQRVRLDLLLEEDRRRGFDLTEAPAVRLHRYRLAADRYRFVLTYHHILLDGWSVPVVSRELLLEVAAEHEGRHVAFPPSRPFAEHVRRVMAQDADGAAAHWRERLSGFAAASEADLLAPTRASSPRPSPSSRTESTVVTVAKSALSIDAAAADRITAAAREAGVTLGTVVLGAWAIALSALSGRTDVVFGVTSSGRDDDLGTGDSTVTATTVGMCLTTLPFRIDVASSLPLKAWLQSIQRRQAEDRQFEHTSVAQLREMTELRAGASLFNTIVVVGNTPLGDLQKAAERLSFADLRVVEFGDFEKTNYALTLMVSPRDGLSVQGLGGAGTDPLAIQRAVSLFCHVIQQMPHGLQRSPAAVSLVAEHSDETMSLTDLGPGVGFDFVAAIEAHAERPDAPALVAGEQTKTYRDLVDAVVARAAHMTNAGVQSGDRVAIAAEPGFALVEVVLAVLRLGAACVPLDPSQPPGRQDRILASARPAAVLATSSFIDALNRKNEAGGLLHGIPVLNLDAPAPRAPPGAERVAYVPGRPAYVLYTSGSTGEPKGVVLPIDTLSRLVAWQNERSGPKACAVTLALAPFGFDVAFQELLSTLVAGGCLVLVDRATRRDPGAILDRIDAHRVTRLFAPFVLLDAIARTAELRERAPATLREVVTAGEALRITPSIRAFFERLAPQAALDNQYGPTEAHVVAAHRLEVDPSEWPELPPIGRRLPGTRLDVRDRWGRRLPDGVVGELYIGGRGLAHGYLGAPARTAERFVPDASAAVSSRDKAPAFGAKKETLSTRVYRTGDLVRRQPDGTIEFVGRIDDQVKVRGFRVELGEIEAVLARHPAVKAAVASIRRTSNTSDSPPSEGRLIAHIVASEDVSSSDTELQAWLQDKLPPYMIPEAIVRISALPLTVSGKVDRRALPAPAQIRSPGTATEPRTETERVVAELWERVLEREGVGAHDSFFDLGGHSLTAVRAASMLGAAIGREVPVTHIFEYPTPA